MHEARRQSGGRKAPVSEGASEVIEENAHGEIGGAAAEEVGAAHGDGIIVEDEDLHVDRLSGLRDLALHLAEELGAADEVLEIAGDRPGKSEAIEMRFELRGPRARWRREGHCELEREVVLEQGATAVDNCDGVVSVVIGGDTVDESTPGTYNVTYEEIDELAVTRALDSIADLQRLPAIFQSRGYSDEDVANIIYGNFVRFLREALP